MRERISAPSIAATISCARLHAPRVSIPPFASTPATTSPLVEDAFPCRRDRRGLRGGLEQRSRDRAAGVEARLLHPPRHHLAVGPQEGLRLAVARGEVGEHLADQSARGGDRGRGVPTPYAGQEELRADQGPHQRARARRRSRGRERRDSRRGLDQHLPQRLRVEISPAEHDRDALAGELLAQ